jgi:hypothetical protein
MKNLLLEEAAIKEELLRKELDKAYPKASDCGFHFPYMKYMVGIKENYDV